MIVNSNKFNSIVNFLVKLSDYSIMRDHKHACALIKGGKILKASVNTIGNRTIGHAEKMLINILKKLSLEFNFKRCILVIIRVSKTQIAYSKPCNNCIEDIRACGIRKVLYSTNDGFEVIKSTDLINSHKTCHYKSNSEVKSHFKNKMKLSSN